MEELHVSSDVVLAQEWWVVCLCAQWCGTCREYRAAFDAFAREWPQVRCIWLDVEDDEDVVDDLDIETFPTILVAEGRNVRFFGPTLPQLEVLQRLLRSLQSDAGTSSPVSSQAQALFLRILAGK